ncbi:MAG TPA: HAMP domain-containing protein, partial [Chloroflexota bacterium]|nr:HAMP domain-containing protein [Chloroflexota bacterium]
MGFLARLRWQLSLSHLAAIAFTLVSMVAMVFVVSGIAFAAQQNPRAEPARDASSVAGVVRAMVRGDQAAPELDAVLRAIASGTLQLQSGGPPWAAQGGEENPWSSTVLRDLDYLVVVGRDGRVLASSDPAGAAFVPPAGDDWQGLLQRVLAGERDASRLVTLRPGNGGGAAEAAGGALGAAPILDQQWRPVGAVIVAKHSLPAPGGSFDFLHRLLLFSAASAAVLAVASVFALPSAGLVAYLLARRLVGRLERLGRAAESLAAGDLSRRVEEGPADEVGQLARRFNHMAGRLAATVSELGAAQARAEEALKAKRELVANVSHELRTPISALQAVLEN